MYCRNLEFLYNTFEIGLENFSRLRQQVNFPEIFKLPAIFKIFFNFLTMKIIRNSNTYLLLTLIKL